MKLLLGLLLVMTGAFADTSDIASVLFDGSNLNPQVSLNTEVTKTVYETRQVRSTCYRTTYRQRCRVEGQTCRQVCRDGRCRRVCTGGRRVCRQVPVQRPYTCFVTRTFPVEVFDYNVVNDVKFSVNYAGNVVPQETFTVHQRGASVAVSIKSSGNYMVGLNKTQSFVRRVGDTRYMETLITANLTDVSVANDVLSGGIRNMRIKNNVLSFDLGSGFNLTDFNFDFKLYRNRSLASDRLLFNRTITNEALIEDNGSVTSVSIDLNSLGVNLPRKKRIIVDIDYKINTAGAVNLDDLSLDKVLNKVFK